MIALSIHNQTRRCCCGERVAERHGVTQLHGSAILIMLRPKLLEAGTKASVVSSRTPGYTAVSRVAPRGRASRQEAQAVAERNHQYQANRIDCKRTQHDAAPDERQTERRASRNDQVRNRVKRECRQPGQGQCRSRRRAVLVGIHHDRARQAGKISWPGPKQRGRSQLRQEPLLMERSGHPWAMSAPTRPRINRSCVARRSRTANP